MTDPDDALTEAVAGLVNEVASWEKNHGNVYMDGSHRLKVSTINKAKQAATDIIMLIRQHDEQAAGTSAPGKGMEMTDRMKLYPQIVLPEPTGDANQIVRSARYGHPQIRLLDDDGNHVADMVGIQRVAIDAGQEGFVDVRVDMIAAIALAEDVDRT